MHYHLIGIRGTAKASLAGMLLAFRRFMNTVPGNLHLIAGWYTSAVREVVAEMGEELFVQK